MAAERIVPGRAPEYMNWPYHDVRRAPRADTSEKLVWSVHHGLPLGLPLLELDAVVVVDHGHMPACVVAP